ncbi:MAG: DEAD/DEAH box helicase, partial [Nanobdellota archaeon]
MEFFNNFKPRLYQQTIFANASKKNTLVVLPTGLGKTAISLMLAASRLKRFEDSKVVIMAPTRPLVSQHYDSFKEMIKKDFIHEDEIVFMTGAISADKRKELWDDAKIVFTTPQGFENDILSGRISLEDVSLMVFDEAHRATGDYSYVWIAEQYVNNAKNQRILALTASPGTDQETINDVCSNLFIEKVEARSKESPDVKPYVQETKIVYSEVEISDEMKEIHEDLKKLHKERIKNIESVFGKLNRKSKNISKKDLLTMQAKLQGMTAKGEAGPEEYKTISKLAEVIKIQHAVELFETQSVFSTLKYCEDLWKQGSSKKSKAAINISKDVNFKNALSKLWKLSDENVEHPKVYKAKEIVENFLDKDPNKKMILFCNYRDTIKKIKEVLKDNENIKPEIFVGQAKKNGSGLTQKKQLELVRKFREGEINVLITSSVGEEGLDIPAVDMVLFYEPVPSAIRQIQRAGRTGRHEKGLIVVLITKNTRDVAYRWATKNKERKMKDILNNAEKTVLKDNDGSLNEFKSDNEKIENKNL